MQAFWENDGKANVEGIFIAVLRPETEKNETGGEQRFEGRTEKEVADKLLNAQLNATEKIRELSTRQPAPAETPDPARSAREFKPRELTADDRFRLGTDLQDPTKAAEAIEEIIQARTGVPPAMIGERFTEEELVATQEKARDACTQFISEEPNFYPCKQNEDRIFRYMQTQGMALTVKNLHIAFRDLSTDGLLALKPADNNNQPDPENQQQRGLPAQPAGPTVRPRRTLESSGLRAGDSSSNTRPPTPAPKYTREQIETMSKSEYRRRLDTDPEFVKFVNSAN